jgi:coenzyme F420-reducing hydrogenase gamma subunit
MNIPQTFTPLNTTISSLLTDQGVTDHKKLVIGWFSFTCCEDSTILFTELLNKYFDEWRKVIEFRHLKVLKTKNELKDLDVAFIEGAVSSESQAKEVKKIRANAKYVVAIGSCACTGMPSSSRNKFVSKEISDRIRWYLSNFDYSEKVIKLEDVITVDDKVNGCPMIALMFIKTVNKYLDLFGIKKGLAKGE